MEACGGAAAAATGERVQVSAAVADLPPVGEELAMTLRMVDAAAAHVNRIALARDVRADRGALGAASWRPLDHPLGEGGATGSGRRPGGLDGVSAMQTLWPSAAAMLE